LHFNREAWHFRGRPRTLWTVTGRAWFVAFLLSAAGCTQGTSGWLLSQKASGSGGARDSSDVASRVSDANAGAPDRAETDAAASAGAAGAASRPAARCPTRFESICSPSVVLDNRDTGPSGQLFAEAIPELATTLPCITRDVCDTLYRKASEIRNITRITVVIEDYDGISEASGVGSEATIRMSSRHMQQVVDAMGNLGDELRGLLYYHGTNIYQFDDGDGAANGWLVQGVANFVRHAAGYLPDNQRMLGGKYDDGFTTTGFFFVWLDARYPDFVYELNASLNPNDDISWSTQVFADITGQSVDALWTSYQASF
jgi:Peptidase of plants and bacteria